MFYSSTLQWMSPEERRKFDESQAKKRLTRPEEIAYWVCELMKDESTVLHGAMIDATMGLGCEARDSDGCGEVKVKMASRGRT